MNNGLVHRKQRPRFTAEVNSMETRQGEAVAPQLHRPACDSALCGQREVKHRQFTAGDVRKHLLPMAMMSHPRDPRVACSKGQGDKGQGCGTDILELLIYTVYFSSPHKRTSHLLIVAISGELNSPNCCQLRGMPSKQVFIYNM